ncbi:hypothetical protein, partial [Candidatus Ruminimicrobium bovinum]|uniref:hypothetical protein n=1 Tax=Candidatus Ruminimicrobium bovinum TaxID=3242779 RepID=UPI0039B96776
IAIKNIFIFIFILLSINENKKSAKNIGTKIIEIKPIFAQNEITVKSTVPYIFAKQKSHIETDKESIKKFFVIEVFVFFKNTKTATKNVNIDDEYKISS